MPGTLLSISIKGIFEKWNDETGEGPLPHCMHTILESLERWVSTVQLPASLEIPEDSTGMDREDWLTFDDRMNRGSMEAVLEGVEWKGEDAMAIAEKLAVSPRAVFQSEFKLFAVSNVFCGALRLLLNHATSPLHVLAYHILGHNRRSSCIPPQLNLFTSVNYNPLRFQYALLQSTSLWKSPWIRFKSTQNRKPTFLNCFSDNSRSSRQSFIASCD